VALNRSIMYFEIYALNCHENYLELYVLSQSTKSLTTNIESCIIENLEALKIVKIRYEYIFAYTVLSLVE
jgi:hypothetical protein